MKGCVCVFGRERNECLLDVTNLYLFFCILYVCAGLEGEARGKGPKKKQLTTNSEAQYRIAFIFTLVHGWNFGWSGSRKSA